MIKFYTTMDCQITSWLTVESAEIKSTLSLAKKRIGFKDLKARKTLQHYKD